MSLKRKSAIALSALALAAAGTAVTTTPAAAEGGCPAATLCLSEDTNYVDIDVTSKTTATNCIALGHYGETGFYNGIKSYVNNLPVKVDVYYWSDIYKAYRPESPIYSGGFSSNTTSVAFYGMRGAVCTGGGNPNILLVS
ncbi:proteinase inhibitor I36 SMPI [Streptomyces roseicoloratus]|uniref:Proteinase inhibitor I36 SMPI n=1 Tax=Streptomyces roseicoloratus TaxID=2508722 RepID=A0ABY9S0C5_9ACTN|nr:proteinase inhibitor I36 SMPI [Streptomyces roseicoloratus]WMX47398.1 proteinase inhibitor I36 SMPI [Streptomyces roseicoloratus]